MTSELNYDMAWKEVDKDKARTQVPRTDPCQYRTRRPRRRASTFLPLPPRLPLVVVGLMMVVVTA